MFIRTTQTGNTASGETYATHRLVESRRVGGKVRQVTLLNLGRHFTLTKERWPQLCARIADFLIEEHKHRRFQELDLALVLAI